MMSIFLVLESSSSQRKGILRERVLDLSVLDILLLDVQQIIAYIEAGQLHGVFGVSVTPVSSGKTTISMLGDDFSFS